MKIELRLFAGVREALGTDALLLELPASATVSVLREHLGAQYPAISTVLQHSRFAIDESYAREDSVIPNGATVACIPPVSGG
jgi:molybdopterin converting factor subunit 1